MGSLWSNAVGTVGLHCFPDRLQIELLRVGRFAAGFALLSVAAPVTFEVPYTAVRGLVRSGPLLVLSLDARVAKPYHRFALCRFSDAPHESLLGAFRLAALVRLLRVLIPVLLGLVFLQWAPSDWVGGMLGRAAAAAMLGWLAWAGFAPLVGFAVAGGPRSRLLGARFERALCERLGLEQASGLVESPVEPAEPVEPPAAAERGAAGRLQAESHGVWGVVGRVRALALVGALGLLASLGAVLAVQQLGVVESVVLPVDEGHAGVADPVRAAARRASTAVAAVHEPCSCERAASMLWDGGVPRLSILIAPRKGEIEPFWIAPGATIAVGHPGLARVSAELSDETAESDEKRPRRRKRRRSGPPAPEVELDVAVVNNSAEPIDAVSLVVTFAQRTGQGARTAIMERGLAWPRPLRPAEAVKWRVEAEGTELRVDCRIEGTLGEHPAASAEQVRELLEARLSPVRVHAAMLLAYLGDPRAREVAMALGPLTAREEMVRAEILRTQTLLRGCDPREGPAGGTLCVENGTTELVRAVTITPAGMGRGGNEPGWTVEDFFRPGTALRVARPQTAAPGGFDVKPRPPSGADKSPAVVPLEP